jgi:hypothetical protein
MDQPKLLSRIGGLGGVRGTDAITILLRQSYFAQYIEVYIPGNPFSSADGYPRLVRSESSPIAA